MRVISIVLLISLSQFVNAAPNDQTDNDGRFGSYHCMIGEAYPSIGVVYSQDTELEPELYDKTNQGYVMVVNIALGSPADKANIPAGAIIKHYNGTPIYSTSQWRALLHDTSVPTADLKLEKDGRHFTVKLTKVKPETYATDDSCYFKFPNDAYIPATLQPTIKARKIKTKQINAKLADFKRYQFKYNAEKSKNAQQQLSVLLNNAKENTERYLIALRLLDTFEKTSNPKLESTVQQLILEYPDAPLSNRASAALFLADKAATANKPKDETTYLEKFIYYNRGNVNAGIYLRLASKHLELKANDSALGALNEASDTLAWYKRKNYSVTHGIKHQWYLQAAEHYMALQQYKQAQSVTELLFSRMEHQNSRIDLYWKKYVPNKTVLQLYREALEKQQHPWPEKAKDLVKQQCDDVNNNEIFIDVKTADGNSIKSYCELWGLPNAAKEQRKKEQLVAIKPIQIQFPKKELEIGIEGWASIIFDIDLKGRVKNCRAEYVYPRSSTFGNAACKAAKKARYKPRMKNGKPVYVKDYPIRLQFRLRN